MSKNLIPEIARMLGVEIGEEFKIKGDASFEQKTYRFTAHGLRGKLDQHQEEREFSAIAAFNYLLLGNAAIVKLPWKPKQDETFYTFGIHATEEKWVVVSGKWWNNVKNLSLYKVGWIYRSQKEAEAALPSVATEMGVSYEL